MSHLEQSALRLGFVPLTDCAPLAVAQAKGLFEAEGLKVTLSREPSWANIRDKVQAGVLDGAHMLGPMALASSLGAGGERVPMIAPLALNMNGSAITVSAALAGEMAAIDEDSMHRRPCSGQPLRKVIDARRARGAPPLVFAAVFPFSIHAYELRYWMAEAGVDPDRDVRLVVSPPPRMTARLRSGEIDGFCVGAPWNEVSAEEGSGVTLIRSAELWPGGPDKVFGVTERWGAEHPRTLAAVLRALLRAQVWADAESNRGELATLLSAPAYVDVPRSQIGRSLEGMAFHRHAAGFPWLSHAAWLLSQMSRWGQVAAALDIDSAARAVYRPDLFRAAAAEVGVTAPSIDSKLEGAHAERWVLAEASLSAIPMPADRFLDGRPFDPDQVTDYLSGFKIRRTRTSASAA